MKSNLTTISIVAISLAVCAIVVSCGKKSDSEQARAPGVAEQAGMAADHAASNTVKATHQTAEEIRAVSDRAAEKTGEVLEKAGADLKEAGQNMQK